MGRSEVWEGVRCGKEWGVGRSGVWEGVGCGKCGAIYLGVVHDWKVKRTILMLIKFTVWTTFYLLYLMPITLPI